MYQPTYTISEIHTRHDSLGRVKSIESMTVAEDPTFEQALASAAHFADIDASKIDHHVYYSIVNPRGVRVASFPVR